jgi:Ca2+-binding EF-hand superfamily protein
MQEFANNINQSGWGLEKIDNLFDLFEALDLNGDGTITLDEMKRTCDDEEIEQMFKKLDMSGDNRIIFKEFKDAVVHFSPGGAPPSPAGIKAVFNEVDTEVDPTDGKRVTDHASKSAREPTGKISKMQFEAALQLFQQELPLNDERGKFLSKYLKKYWLFACCKNWQESNLDSIEIDESQFKDFIDKIYDPDHCYGRQSWWKAGPTREKNAEIFHEIFVTQTNRMNGILTKHSNLDLFKIVLCKQSPDLMLKIEDLSIEWRHQNQVDQHLENDGFFPLKYAEKFFNLADTDGDGNIDEDEFCDFFEIIWDENSSGFIQSLNKGLAAGFE